MRRLSVHYRNFPMTNNEGGNNVFFFYFYSGIPKANKNHGLFTYTVIVCSVCYVHNKYITVIFFVRGSMKCMFRIIRVSQLSVHPFANITPDNREYTPFCFTDDICLESS
jgi:hypothetical protein